MEEQLVLERCSAVLQKGPHQDEDVLKSICRDVRRLENITPAAGDIILLVLEHILRHDASNLSSMALENVLESLEYVVLKNTGLTTNPFRTWSLLQRCVEILPPPSFDQPVGGGPQQAPTRLRCSEEVLIGALKCIRCDKPTDGNVVDRLEATELVRYVVCVHRVESVVDRGRLEDVLPSLYQIHSDGSVRGVCETR